MISGVVSIVIANIAYGDTDPPTYNKIVNGKVIDSDMKKVIAIILVIILIVGNCMVAFGGFIVGKK